MSYHLHVVNQKVSKTKVPTTTWISQKRVPIVKHEFRTVPKKHMSFSSFVISFKPDLAVIKSVCLNYNETMADQKFETQTSD